MRLSKTTKFLSFILIIFIIALCVFTYFYFNQSNKTKAILDKFLTTYISRDIDNANKYLFEDELPNIPSISSNILKSQTEDKREIINTLEELMFSIDYEIISSKQEINNSVITVKFTYNDISKNIIEFFKSPPENSEDMFKDFINYIKSNNSKVSSTIEINVCKINGDWYVILSEKLLNILTSGIYKNFRI